MDDWFQLVRSGITIQGHLPGSAYQFIPPEASIEPAELGEGAFSIHLEATVIENVVPNPDNPIDIKHEIILGELKPGIYEILLSVNGREAFHTKFHTADGVVITPAPLPDVPISPYNTSLVLEPVHPKPGEEFSIYAVGEFPSTGYSITNTSIIMTKSIPAIVIVNLNIQEASGEQADVMVPFRELIGTVILSEGRHTLRGSINEKPFFIGFIAVESESSGGPNPIPLFNKASIEIVPPYPKPGEVFSVYAIGEFPTPGHTFLTKELKVLESEPVQLAAELTVSMPRESQDQVITSFRESIGTEVLPEGEYPITATLNGIEIYNNRLIVAEYNPISQGPFIEPKVIYRPAHPQPGEPFTVFVVGEFPTPGFTFSHKALNVAESMPEQLAIELVVEKPTEPQAQVITPFEEVVGTATLGEGIHPVYGTINSIPFYKEILLVGSEPESHLLRFERSGGFAGFLTAFDLDRNGTVEYTREPDLGERLERGQLQDAVLEEIVTLLETVAHESLSESYQPETPIADGYNYVLSAEDRLRDVRIDQGAILPAILETLFEISTYILNGGYLQIPAVFPPSIPLYNPTIVTEPVVPRAGEEFSIYLTGEFPSTGYTFVEKSITIAESYPEQIFIRITVKEPEGPAATVITPFHELIGTATLGAGNKPINADVNGERIYSAILTVGGDAENALVRFERSGGLMGATTVFSLYPSGYVEFEHDPVMEDQLERGQVLRPALEELIERLNGISFESIDPHYKPQAPIADGYNYILSYNELDKISVDQGADVPPELKEVLTLLEEIMDGRSLSESDESVTAVENWQMM